MRVKVGRGGGGGRREGGGEEEEGKAEEAEEEREKCKRSAITIPGCKYFRQV